MAHRQIRRIVAVQPPLEANHRHKKIMPLGLGYLLAVVRRSFPDMALSCLDLQGTGMDLATGEEELLRRAPDVVLMTCWTPMAESAYRLLAALRQKSVVPPLLICGGVHPTLFPEEVLKYCDYVITHEGEATLVELLQCLRADKDPAKVAGLWYRRDGKAVATPPRPFIADLDTLPFPAWDLLPMEAYTTPMHLVGGRRVPVMGSRGCPYGCSYCVSPQFWRRQLRWRSPARVVDEMEALYRRFGIRSIHFWDDNLFLDGEYLAGLCRELIARRLPLRWVGLTRASHIVQQQHLLSLVRAAGCLGMELGIETADPEAHRQVGKDESLDQTRQAAELLKQHGLYPMFTYMAFNPGDTLASYYHQAQFIDQILAGCAWAEYFHPLEVPVYVGQFCTPHPGTQLYTEAPRLGTVFAGGWPDYYHHRVNFLPNSLLDDVPRRNACRLCNLDYWLVARAAVSGYYRMIPARASLGLRLRRLAAAANLTRAWWQLTDGRHRVRDILAAVEHRFFAERQDTVSVSAIIVLVLAQRGVLAGTTPVPVRAIDLTRSDYQRRGRWKMLGIRTLALLQRAHLLPRP